MKRETWKFQELLGIFKPVKSLLEVLKSLCIHLCAEWSLSRGLAFCANIPGITLFQMLETIWKKQSKLNICVVSLVPWRHTYHI